MSVIELKTPVPGPRSRELMARRQAAVPRGPFHATPVFIQEARGASLTDVDGNRFLDFAGGIGCLNVGHANPAVVRAAAPFLRRRGLREIEAERGVAPPHQPTFQPSSVRPAIQRLLLAEILCTVSTAGPVTAWIFAVAKVAELTFCGRSSCLTIKTAN